MWYSMKIPLLTSYKYFGGKNSGEIEQHFYTLRGKGFSVSMLASEGYVIFYNKFHYGRMRCVVGQPFIFQTKKSLQQLFPL